MSAGLRMLAKAEAAIAAAGALLVYPVDNRPEPASLWSVLHPRTAMRWAWDEGADARVVRLWQLREELASRRRVVYSKWYKGRATFFSRALFTAMLAARAQRPGALSSEARELLALLEEDSPQSSKRLRRNAGLSGRPSERIWTRAMRELWEALLIVGTGEVDDGAFPSLEVGATRWVFEELWEEAQRGVTSEQEQLLVRVFGGKKGVGAQWRKG